MEMVGAVSLSSLCCSIPRTNKRGAALGFSSSLSTLLLNKAKVKSVTVSVRRNRNKGLTCNALFGLGVPELVVIAGVAALVFGPKKLPEVGRSIGQTVKSFQQFVAVGTDEFRVRFIRKNILFDNTSKPAAKEFESELKKEPNSTGGEPSEKPAALSEQAKQDTEVSSSKESV